MPRPKSDETKSEFVSRCMSQVNNEEGKKDWPKERKLAHCYGIWEQYKESSSELKFVVAVGEPEHKYAEA